MKKKFISVAMFSALLISTPIFVGCSDYDDDISNLQGQIDSLKGPDISSSEALTALNNALNDLKADVATITSGKADNAAVIELQEKVTELTNLINGSSEDGQIEGLAEQIKGLVDQIENLQEQVNAVDGDLDEKYAELVKEKEALEKDIEILNEKIAKAATAEEADSLKQELDKHVQEWNTISQDVKDAATWVDKNGESLAKLTNEVATIQALINAISVDGKVSDEILAAIAGLKTTNSALSDLQNEINGTSQKTGILERLTQIEEWKSTITLALLDNGFVETVDGNNVGSMAEAIEELANIKIQLANGEDPNSPTILDRLDNLEKNFAALQALASQVQSIVFVPSNYDDPYKLESEKLMILKPGTTNDFQLVGVKNENTISFRITPASAVKDFTKNYKLTFDGSQVRGTVTGLEVGEAQIDEANGIVTYQITNPPTVSNGYQGWAVCAKLTANTDKDENDQIINNNGTDLVSNYFVIGNHEYYYKNITVDPSIAINSDVECYLDEPTENSKWDLTGSFQNAIGGIPCAADGTSSTGAVWTRINFASYDATPTLSYNARTSGVFDIESGVLMPANAGNAEIGRSSMVDVTISVAGITYANANSFNVSIVRRTVNVDINEAWPADITIKWNGSGIQYIELPAEYTSKAINATELNTDDFFNLTDMNAGSRSGVYLIKGNDITSGATDVEGNAIDVQSLYLAITSGASISSTGQTLSLKLGEIGTGSSSTTMTSTYTFNVKVAGTDFTWLGDTQDKLTKAPGQWNGDNMALNLNVVSGSLNKTFNLDDFYSNINALRTAAASVGATVSYEMITNPVSGVALSSGGTLTFDAGGSQYDYKDTPEMKIRVKITFGSGATAPVYTEHTATYTVNSEINGVWTNPAATMELPNLNGTYYPLKGMKWIDYRESNLISWNETTNTYELSNDLSSIYGNSDAEIGFVSGRGAAASEPLMANDPNNYLQIAQTGANKGKLTFTTIGTSANFPNAVEAVLRIKVSSRWGEIKGIEKGYYDILLTIPSGAHQSH